MKSIGIIGYGALGSSLAHALHNAGLLSWICIRNEHHIQQAQELNVPIFNSIDEINVLDCSIILAVVDSSIQVIAQEIHHSHSWKGCHALMHCSGSLGTDVLRGADSSIKLIAMHPFQTIVTHADLPNTPWGIDCDASDFAEVSGLIESMHGIPYALSIQAKANKSLYHATAVASSNLLQMLIALTTTIADEAGIPSELFLPRIQSTTLKRAHDSLANNQSALQDLTGPLIRCDIQTIQANREAIRLIPGMDAVYVSLCKATIPQLKAMQKLTDLEADILMNALNIQGLKE
ncbi:MAG: DUF2520 domain-containing protein [Ignavibacteria bacterium]|nr:DUF2520 domain-containing protein [Ignavibacteria bacterium]